MFCTKDDLSKHVVASGSRLGHERHAIEAANMYAKVVPKPSAPRTVHIGCPQPKATSTHQGHSLLHTRRRRTRRCGRDRHGLLFDLRQAHQEHMSGSTNSKRCDVSAPWLMQRGTSALLPETDGARSPGKAHNQRSPKRWGAPSQLVTPLGYK